MGLNPGYLLKSFLLYILSHTIFFLNFRQTTRVIPDKIQTTPFQPRVADQEVKLSKDQRMIIIKPAWLQEVKYLLTSRGPQMIIIKPALLQEVKLTRGPQMIIIEPAWLQEEIRVEIQTRLR